MSPIRKRDPKPLFRTILVAADFSASSRQAFRVACALARADMTRLIILHAVEPVHVLGPPIAFGELGVPIALALSDQPHPGALKERLCELYVPDRPLDVAYHTRDGDPAAEILRAVDEFRCDLIVLGTHGRTGLGRILAGSVAETVLRKARCPVLALRAPELLEEDRVARRPEASTQGRTTPAPQPGAPRGSQPTGLSIRAILHPTDFSDPAGAARQVARALARDHGARLIVLHVAPRIEVLNLAEPVIPTDPAIYREALEGLREAIEGPDLKTPVETQLRQGEAATEILRAAAESECDLIVLGTHGRTALGRLVMGSVTEEVLRGSGCPVLAVKTPVPAASAAREELEPETLP